MSTLLSILDKDFCGACIIGIGITVGCGTTVGIDVVDIIGFVSVEDWWVCVVSVDSSFITALILSSSTTLKSIFVVVGVRFSTTDLHKKIDEGLFKIRKESVSFHLKGEFFSSSDKRGFYDGIDKSI